MMLTGDRIVPVTTDHGSFNLAELTVGEVTLAAPVEPVTG